MMKLNLEKIKEIKGNSQEATLESFENMVDFPEYENKPLVHELKNGDVFTLQDKLSLEFEDNKLYEVVFDGYVDKVTFVEPKWVRTGTVYTMEEVNEMYTK